MVVITRRAFGGFDLPRLHFSMGPANRVPLATLDPRRTLARTLDGSRVSRALLHSSRVLHACRRNPKAGPQSIKVAENFVRNRIRSDLRIRKSVSDSRSLPSTDDRSQLPIGADWQVYCYWCRRSQRRLTGCMPVSAANARGSISSP